MNITCCGSTDDDLLPPGQSSSAKNSETKSSKSRNKVNKQPTTTTQIKLFPNATISTLASSSQPEEFPYRATPAPLLPPPTIPQLPPQIPPLLLAYQYLPNQSVSNLQRKTTSRSGRSNNSSSEHNHSQFLNNQNNLNQLQRPEPVYGNNNNNNNLNYQHQQQQQQQQQQQHLFHQPSTSTLLSASPNSYGGLEMNMNNGGGRNRGNSTAGGSTYQPSGLREESRRMSTSAVESEEGKLSVGIDFGTTYSGIAYGSTRMYSGGIRQLLNWPGSYETYRKIPSCILYAQASPNEEARIISWGLKAKSSPVLPGTIKCEWFKLFLSPESLRSGRPDDRLPPLPYGKQPVDVICDFLGCLWRYAKEQITIEIGSVADLDSADVLLTVPAAWDAAGCALMREAAIRAGLVQSSRGGDKNWRDRLRIITEPEAAGIHASTLSALHHLRPGQTFVIVDAGGGTVDTAVYRILGQLSQLEIAEVCVRSGSNSGSLFVDLKFEELVRRILKDHPIHLDASSMEAFMHAFCETDKLAYRGDADDDNALFRFNCFNTLDSYDPTIGLEHGELAIPGHVLKTEVFDPIIQQVLALISLQISKVPTLHIDAIILVGGFAASAYLFRRVQEVFGAEGPHKIGVIARPMDCDVATLQGAARYGLGIREGRVAVSNIITPRAYIIKVKLPVEMVDRIQRPQFIVRNDAGMEVCTNRASYLVARGAVLKKGGRLRSRFCKYANGPSDSFFQAVLYVSDSDSIYRYTDEGEIGELCRWNVDLAALPAFHRITRFGGGYVEFDLGLELDSAEVRGVLLTDEGIECGRGTFDFI